MMSQDESALGGSDRRARASVARAASVVYVAALAQGLTVVSFPASGALFKARGLTDAEYGALFLPQVGFTLLASLLGARLAERLGLPRLLALASLASMAAAGLLYAGSVVEPARAFPVLLAGTSMLGTGFGLSAAPLNTLPTRLFPARRDTALLALHTLMGSGFAAGPGLAGRWIRAGTWQWLPLGLAVLNLALGVLASGDLLASGPAPSRARERPALPLRDWTLWGFIGAAVIYAFAEGTFSNWAILYLHEERGLSAASAGLALSSFWGALVVGRLASSVLVTRFPAERLWLALPIVMVAAFLGVSVVGRETTAGGAFALAGMSCSALFPLTVTLASRRFPEHAVAVSAAMIAALMFGVGLASFSIGALRVVMSLQQIYRASTAYPLLLLALGGVLFGSRLNARRAR
jgi:fucose permease